ncbi:hypothetical protein [Micromonospora humida]|uniref:hypothetical protein n=1 Tax=Micromonospora humida TaxID=2809018 RepID=UPI0033F0D6B4
MSGYTRFQDGDILLPKITPTFEAGRSVLISGLRNGTGAGTTEIHVLRPTREIDPRFLAYITRSQPFLKLGEAEMYGVAGQKRVPDNFVRDFEAYIPAIEEQRRVADFLDEAMAGSDKLTSMLNAALRLLDERDLASMASAFDGTFRLSNHLSGESWSLPLRRVVARWVDYRGATPAKTPFGIPLVTAKNIKGGGIDLALAPEFIAEGDFDEWMRRGLPEVGDVLLTTEAPLGEVARIADPNIALAQRVILMKANHSMVDPEWIYWYLRSPVGQRELFARATGSTALGIKADRLRSVPIQLFNRGDMTARLLWLSARIGETRQLRAPIKGQLALLSERRQALITAAVTGQVDVTTAQRVRA